MRQEAGGHRIQRVPPTETRGRVHTSTVTVAIVEQGVIGGFSAEDCDVEWYSGSGAGGQHRNKHQNSCRLRHRPTGIVRTAQTRKRENSYKLAVEAMREAVDGVESSRVLAAANVERKGQIGSGMRGDKRRTYRFREDAVTDHVTGKTCRCAELMRGHFEKLWR